MQGETEIVAGIALIIAPSVTGQGAPCGCPAKGEDIIVEIAGALTIGAGTRRREHQADEEVGQG